MIIYLVLLLAGIVTLYFCADFFIKGASGTAEVLKIRPIIIGVIVVAFATSAPEFCVSILAAIKKSSDLAIGNIVGSCICNIGLALGLSAIIRPIEINRDILRRELPFLVIVTILFFVICIDYRISRFEAALLFVGFIGFLYYSIRNAKGKVEDLGIDLERAMPKGKAFTYLGIGLAGLLLGAHMIVTSAVRIAAFVGISELVIGLTVVAIGTSLPELAASLMASARGEGDISIGNIIGSNIFNILLIVGTVCMIRPVIVDSSISLISLPLLIVLTVLMVPILRSENKISRREGLILVIFYIGYIIFLVKR